MRVAKLLLADGRSAVGVLEDPNVWLLDTGGRLLADVLNCENPHETVRKLRSQSKASVPVSSVRLLAPVDTQEIWAAGVTYKRSQVARMEESVSGASHYDKVYTAPRPELFLKATPHRVSGPGQPVRVRSDSRWSVPEPELTLVISPTGRLLGLSAGNDMSARDIEGENPLYLPQAKLYRECCSIGPCIWLPEGTVDRATLEIRMTVQRGGEVVFRGETSAGQMVREFAELIDWLFKENTFPQGVLLLTGTGVVPPDDFTLEHGDAIAIEISEIGILENVVVKD